MELIFLIASWIGGDIGRLDAERWDVREDAQTRLKSWGLCAVPQLLRAARESEAPEVRARCRELLVPYQRATAKLRAIAVLSGPHLPSEAAFFHDATLRADAFRLARQAGCVDYDSPYLPFQFTPDHELTPCDALALLIEYRRQLGYHRELWELVGEAVAVSAGDVR